jgi:hypothetical protein
MRLIEKPNFPLSHDLKLVALQGDSGLRTEITSSGGMYVVNNPVETGRACVELIERARNERAHLALIPELVIPATVLSELVETIRSSQEPLVVIGGLEGISLADYRILVTEFGDTPDIAASSPGTFVNAMLIAVKTATSFDVKFRAKRYPSGAENKGGPELALGSGEFVVLRLGSAPFTIVPVICSELIWPELWEVLAAEVNGFSIDLIPVLQRNCDIERRHLDPVIYRAYQNNRRTRFVLANQALLPESDGTCFVLGPPISPKSPAFDHGRRELWLPDSCTYRGFRVPERTGCFWYAEVVHPDGPMSATQAPIYKGHVLAVLKPYGVDLTGLPAGLMRSVAANKYVETSDLSWLNTEPKRQYRSSLSPGTEYVLDGAVCKTASVAFHRMIYGTNPTWSTVESLVADFIDAGALLASCGESVRIGPCPGGNCNVAGRSVAIIYSPDVDSALSARFSNEVLLSGDALPSGIVLLKVEATSRNPRAKTVGDVLRADRISSESPELSDGPVRVVENSVSVGLGDICFCEPRELRPNLEEATLVAARNRTSVLLPGVFV